MLELGISEINPHRIVIGIDKMKDIYIRNLSVSGELSECYREE